MSIDPARGQTLNTLRASSVSSLVRKHKRELLHECEVPRRARFRITAYVSTTGSVMSLGGTAFPGGADARFDCVLDQVSRWHLSKQKRIGKLSFELR
jgi:hypothetical protein